MQLMQPPKQGPMVECAMPPIGQEVDQRKIEDEAASKLPAAQLAREERRQVERGAPPRDDDRRQPDEDLRMRGDDDVGGHSIDRVENQRAQGMAFGWKQPLENKEWDHQPYDAQQHDHV